LCYFNNQILGGGGELFFPFPPTFSTRRPEPMIILNLKSDPNSIWNQDLPQNWRHVELRISSSFDFQEEFLQASRYVPKSTVGLIRNDEKKQNLMI
jgi:hypothetical protein